MQTSVAAKMAGKYHAHGCSDCGLRYADACQYPLVNELCQLCRGRERPLWERSTDPADCCFENSRLVGAVEASRFFLGGDTLWFKCRVCARTHPFDPKEAV
jgi:hypothetical protein